MALWVCVMMRAVMRVVVYCCLYYMFGVDVMRVDVPCLFHPRAVLCGRGTDDSLCATIMLAMHCVFCVWQSC